MCLPRTRHTFGLFCCLLETVLLSGSIHGFVALIPLLQRDGVYFDICRNLSQPIRQGSDLKLSVLYHYDSTVLWLANDEVYRWFRCEAEEKTFTLIFTVSMFASSFVMVMFGWIYDRFGTWIVRIIAIVLLIIGNMMAAFTDRSTSDMLWPAMIFISVGGLAIFMTNLQLSNTFYSKRSIWLGVYVALYFISSGVYLVIKALSDHLDIARRYLFFILLAAAILPISTTFCFHPINQVLVNPYDVALFTSSSHIKMNSKKIHRETLARERDEEDIGVWMKDRKLEGVTWSLSFILHAFWFGALQGQCWVLTSLRYTLVPITEKDVYLNRREEVFCYLQLTMGLVAVCVGLITDTQRWRVVKDFVESETFHVKACVFAVVLTTLPAGVLAGVVFIPYAHILYLVDVLILMVRVMSLTTSCLFIFQVFPQKYFGRLWGITQCLGAVMGVSYILVQILHGPLDSVHHNNHAYIKLGVATAVLLALSHPVHLLVRIKRLEHASINAHPVGQTSPSPDDIIFLPVEELRKANQAEPATKIAPSIDASDPGGETRSDENNSTRF